jgi:hypothetical protein
MVAEPKLFVPPEYNIPQEGVDYFGGLDELAEILMLEPVRPPRQSAMGLKSKSGKTYDFVEILRAMIDFMHATAVFTQEFKESEDG